LQVLPPIELEFRNLAEGTEAIATSKVKWDWEYQKRRGIELGFPTDLPEPVQNLIARTGKRVYKALNMSGYGRIDLRVTPEGKAYVIEANPNPDISYGCELPESAEKAGMGYTSLIQRIVKLGMAYQAEWREAGV
jgi:D-alanine-D-alanine ligase